MENEDEMREDEMVCEERTITYTELLQEAVGYGDNVHGAMRGLGECFGLEGDTMVTVVVAGGSHWSVWHNGVKLVQCEGSHDEFYYNYEIDLLSDVREVDSYLAQCMASETGRKASLAHRRVVQRLMELTGLNYYTGEDYVE